MRKKLRIYLALAVIILWAWVLVPKFIARAHLFKRRIVCPQIKAQAPKKAVVVPDKDELITEAFAMLKVRQDEQAMAIYRKILELDPEDSDALWGKAEIYRRKRQFSDSEAVLNEILKNDPCNAPGLISLSYLRYYDNRLDEALDLINRALAVPGLDDENKALAYMMLGTVNSRRSSQGWLFSKFKYGTQIKSYFLTAQSLAPDLPEVHLGLGTFYLKAPAIAGGNLDKAIDELQTAIKIAPSFATANARLAQAYKKKGDLDKYNLFLQKAKDLDPGNEVLAEDKKE
jgi:tetratricopeptide (TPR) repeat protein